MLAAINDFHGNLELPAGGLPEIDNATRALTRTPAGDLVGASPLASGYFDDEPAIEAMNSLGLDFNGVGNHEFDRGRAELLRLQSGGCPSSGCQAFFPPFPPGVSRVRTRWYPIGAAYSARAA